MVAIVKGSGFNSEGGGFTRLHVNGVQYSPEQIAEALAAWSNLQTAEKALQRAKRLFDEALPKFDWGKSPLDGNAIMLLNEVPGEVTRALKDINGG